MKSVFDLRVFCISTMDYNVLLSIVLRRDRQRGRRSKLGQTIGCDLRSNKAHMREGEASTSERIIGTLYTSYIELKSRIFIRFSLSLPSFFLPFHPSLHSRQSVLSLTLHHLTCQAGAP